LKPFSNALPLVAWSGFTTSTVGRVS